MRFPPARADFESDHPEPEPPSPLPRLFLHDPAWRLVVKPDHDREFCHAKAPGRDEYHRLSRGELHLDNGEERLCVPCARRRGILSLEPRALKRPGADVELAVASFDDDVPGLVERPKPRSRPDFDSPNDEPPRRFSDN